MIFQWSFSFTSRKEIGTSVPARNVAVPSSVAPDEASIDRFEKEKSLTSNSDGLALAAAVNASSGWVSFSGAEKYPWALT